MQHSSYNPAPEVPLLLRSLLLACDCSPGPLVSPGIRMSPLTSYGEATTMSQPPIGPDVHEALDVHGDLGPERPLHLVIALDLFPERIDLLVGQILGPAVGVHSTGSQDLSRPGPPDPIDIGQGNLDSLAPG